jgi:hypothetical protein
MYVHRNEATYIKSKKLTNKMFFMLDMFQVMFSFGRITLCGKCSTAREQIGYPNLSIGFYFVLLYFATVNFLISVFIVKNLQKQKIALNLAENKNKFFYFPLMKYGFLHFAFFFANFHVLGLFKLKFRFRLD